MAHGVDRTGAASGSGASDNPITQAIVDAKGDLIAGTSADTAARLAVGANETRLVADSTQATGLKYVADTTNYAVGAKGDLLAGTAADTLAALGVGAAGEMLMPASGASTGLAWLRAPAPGAFLINGKITRTVAASALTISVKTLADADPSTSSPVYVMVPTATSNVLDGGYVIRSITAALSLTISSGSTLGHASAAACPVYIYLLDNAGTLELAASTKFFGGQSVQSTTAEGGAGAADSATVLYSTTLRSNVVVVCLQRWKSTQTTAGTWAATTGEVQLYPFPYKAPTITTLTSGSSATYTRPWDALALDVFAVGGGSGGAGGNGNSSSAGSDTTFTDGTTTLTAKGGPAATIVAASVSPVQATGGDINGFTTPGQTSTYEETTVTVQRGGTSGGNSPLGGAGGGSYNGASANAATNSGSGGGGGSTATATTAGGNGGNAGAWCRKMFASLTTTYTYTVGGGSTGGTAGAGGVAGGNGGSGIIIITELYG